MNVNDYWGREREDDGTGGRKGKIVGISLL